MKHDRHRVEGFVARIELIRRPIISYCRHLLWNEQELEDTIQTVLSTAYMKYDTFDAEGDFRSWVFTICTNVVLNVNRRSAKEQQRFVCADERINDVVAELQKEYAYDELLRDPEKIFAHVGDELRAALLSLSTSERTVFLLKTIGELTCKEIAESLKMPIGTVMAYLSRSRGKLRVHLTEYAKQYGFLSNEVREATTDGL
ncbi:MAG: RNA polymerase sigma factor [Candidatus Zixiibacteriota bacterium]